MMVALDDISIAEEKRRVVKKLQTVFEQAVNAARGGRCRCKDPAVLSKSDRTREKRGLFFREVIH